MALLFIDSFDHYATADFPVKWTAFGGTLAIAAGAGRRSGGALRLTTVLNNSSNQWAQKALITNGATCVMGFAITVPAGTVGSSGMAIAAIRDGGTTQMTLRLNSDYTATVLRGAQNGTVLANSVSVVLAAGSYAYIEWKVRIDPTVGTVDVRVNGNLVPGLSSLTSQNTRNSSNSTWSSVILGALDAISNMSNTNTRNLDYDDVYILDGSGTTLNDFLGDCRVDARVPSGAGVPAVGWTPSAGANWQCVDEMPPAAAPNGDVDYVSVLTTGATDTYAVQDVAVPGATIYGVQMCLSVKKADAGLCLVAPVIRHAGTTYEGGSANPGTTYAFATTQYSNNPGTGAPWVEADFNAAEFGVRKTG